MIRDRDFKPAAVRLRPHLSGLILVVSVCVSFGMSFGAATAAGNEPFYDWGDYAGDVTLFGGVFSAILLALCAGPFVGYVQARSAWLPRHDHLLRLAWGAPLGTVLVMAWCAVLAVNLTGDPGFTFSRAAKPNLAGPVGELVSLLSGPWTPIVAWVLGSWLLGALLNPVVIRRWLGVSTPGRCDKCGYAVADGSTCPECGQFKQAEQRPEDRRPW